MADHFSGPGVMGDPAVDLTDFYAFVSPERAGHMVLIANVFPLAGEGALFSDAVDYGFRLRAASRDASSITGFSIFRTEANIVARFGCPVSPGQAQPAAIVLQTGEKVEFQTGTPAESLGMRVFAGLRSDPFFMDVAAAKKTDQEGRLAYTNPGTNTVQFRDCLSIVVEISNEAVFSMLGRSGLIAAVAETGGRGGHKALRIERLGRPELKNLVLSSPAHDHRSPTHELRDLYNREDAFDLSVQYRPLYQSRLDGTLSFFDNLDGEVAWPMLPDGGHPLREMFLNDCLVLDPTLPFSRGNFLEIEQSLLADKPHRTSGGRWLDDDIVDEMLTLFVNGGKGPRVGDFVDAPTKPADLHFPFVREPNLKRDLPPLEGLG